MKKPEEAVNIRSLSKQGYSHRAIARLMGIDRRTVKKYLQQDSLPFYKKIKRQSLIENYKPLVEGWLEQDDYQASKIHELLQCEGFKGSYDIVQRHVKKIKQKRDKAAYIRFETLPGQQAQVDFADFQISRADGTEITLYCFIMVLGYSRHMYIEFIDKCVMSKFLSCHQHAFGFFGGIPSEILYDNMKNVVIKRFAGNIQWNREFLSFAMHYGFNPLAAPAYSPWVKGKVERPIDYLRERFWRGYIFTDILVLNKDVLQWINNVAGQRIHGTTKENPLLRFSREKESLGQLPPAPFDVSEKVWRKVFKDCQISFRANRYVLPHECAQEKVLLKIKDAIMRVYKDDKMVAVYQIPASKGQTIANPKFYQRLKEDKNQLNRKYHRPFGKAKATRGLLSSGLQYEVMRRSISEYEQLTAGGLQ